MSQIDFHATGPYLKALFLCERVLEEKDGVNSYIRVIDRFGRTIIGDADEETSHVITATLVIHIEKGQAEGPIELGMTLVPPSGNPVAQPAASFNVPPGSTGATVHVPLQLDVTEQGRYDMEVNLNGKMCGSARFTVETNRFPGPGAARI